MRVAFPLLFTVAPVILASLAGCATGGSGQKFSVERTVEAPADRALVYVYRKNAQPTMWSATVIADGREVASLSQGDYMIVTVPEGARHFGAHWAALSGQKDSSLDLDVKAGKTYFVELVGLSQMTGVSSDSLGVKLHYRIGSGMLEHGPEAKDEMALCCKAVSAN